MKLFSVTNCLITFLLGWVFGSIFIFLLLIYQEELLTNRKFITAFNQPVTSNSAQHKEALKYQKHQQTLMPEQLPQSLLSSESIDRKKFLNDFADLDEPKAGSRSKQNGHHRSKPSIIYLYWPYADNHFSVHQYSVLESLLGNFPQATFRITLLPTKAQFLKLLSLAKEESLPTLKNLKIADMIHPRMFEKYRRLNFDIQLSFLTVEELTAVDEDGANEIDPTNKDTDDFNLKDRRKKVQVEQQYLLRYLGVCCDACEILCFSPPKELLARNTHNNLPHSKTSDEKDGFATNPEIPYHLIAYLHLLLLYKTGGLFSDFSFYFINPLESTWIHQGYFIHAYCNHIPMTSKRRYQQGRNRHSDFYSNYVEIYYPKLYDNWKELQCYSSTIFYFAQRQNIIAQCLLEKYSIDKVFQICIESDTFFHGANCIKEALDQCLHSINEEKLTILKKKESIEKRLAVLYASFYREHSPKIPKFLINSFSDELPDYLSTLHLPYTFPEEASRTDGFQGAKAAWLELESKTTGLLESFHDNPIHANRTLLATHNWTVSRNTIILWMGHLAWQQIYLSATYLTRHLSHQHHHFYQHHFYPYPSHSLLDVAEKRNRGFQLSQNKLTKRREMLHKFYQCQHYRDIVTIPQYLLQFLIEQWKKPQYQHIDNPVKAPIHTLHSVPITNRERGIHPEQPQLIGAELLSVNTSQTAKQVLSNISHHILSNLKRNISVADDEIPPQTQFLHTKTSLSLRIRNITEELHLRMIPPATTQQNQSISLSPISPNNSTTTMIPFLPTSALSGNSSGSNTSSSLEHHHLRGYHSERRARRRLFFFGGKKALPTSIASNHSVFLTTSRLRSNRTMYDFSLEELFLSSADPNSVSFQYHERLDHHDRITDTLSTLQEHPYENDLHCNPAIFLIGFPYAASNELLSQLRNHPLILAGYDRIYYPSSETVEEKSRKKDMIEGCYNVILPDHRHLHQANGSMSWHRFSRSSCYPFLHQNESFVLIDTSLRYTLNPFTPFLIRQDHAQAKFLFFVENPVHRLLKHSHSYCSRLKDSLKDGFTSMDSFLLSFIEDPLSPLSQFRTIVDEYLDWKDRESSTSSGEGVKHAAGSDGNDDTTFNYDINHIIEYYYLQLSLQRYYSVEEGSFESSPNHRESQRIGFDLLLSSIYFPSLYYYLDLFPIESLLILNSEDYQLEQQQLHERLANNQTVVPSEVLRTILDFLQLQRSEKITTTTIKSEDNTNSYEQVLADLSLHYYSSPSNDSHSQKECDISIEMYNRLVHFYLPFNLLLEQYLNFSIIHWNDDYDNKTWNFRPMDLDWKGRERNSPSSPSLLWYEVKDTENHRWKKWKEDQEQLKVQRQKKSLQSSTFAYNQHSSNVVGKLLPQRNSEEDSSFNTTLGMLNTF